MRYHFVLYAQKVLKIHPLSSSLVHPDELGEKEVKEEGVDG